MKKYNIQVTNTILEDKHFQQMGLSIWLFLWFLDRMTKIDDQGNGKVLGGKPITYEDIKESFDISRPTYSRWLKSLKNSGYISTIRTPNGNTIIVHKAKKGYIKNDTSDVSNMNSDVSQMIHRYIKNDTSNIRQYKDNTKTIEKSIKNDYRGLESPAKERIRNWLNNKANNPV